MPSNNKENTSLLKNGCYVVSIRIGQTKKLNRIESRLHVIDALNKTTLSENERRLLNEEVVQLTKQQVQLLDSIHSVSSIIDSIKTVDGSENC